MIKKDLFRFQPPSYITIDVETENLNLYSSRPWQASWLVVKDRKVVETHDYYIYYPDLNISKGAAEVTRFDRSKYESLAKDPKEVYSILEKYLYNPEFKVVGQNILAFDTYQIANFQKYVGAKVDWSYIQRIYDTMGIFKAYKSGVQFPENKEQILPWLYSWCEMTKKGLKSSLSLICSEFDIPFDKNLLHDSQYDIQKTYEVFEALIKTVEIH